MADKTEVQTHGDYILLTVEGDDFELESWTDALSKAVTSCVEESKTKLLIKDLIQEDFDFHEIEGLTDKLPNLEFQILKVSVYVANEKRKLSNYFGEASAFRKELNLRIFLNIDSAIAWLNEN